MATALAAALMRHPRLSYIAVADMYRLHPRGASRYTPVVHVDPVRGPSIYLNVGSVYRDRMAGPDAIEYHPSIHSRVNEDLERLVDKDVALFVQDGREARRGRVRVVHGRVAGGGRVAPDGGGVYILELLPVVGGQNVERVRSRSPTRVDMRATAGLNSPRPPGTMRWAAAARGPAQPPHTRTPASSPRQSSVNTFEWPTSKDDDNDDAPKEAWADM